MRWPYRSGWVRVATTERSKLEREAAAQPIPVDGGADSAVAVTWPCDCPHYHEYHGAICCRVGRVCGPRVRQESKRGEGGDCCADPGPMGAWRSVLGEVTHAARCGDAFGTANDVLVAFGARGVIRDYLRAAGWSMRVMFYDYTFPYYRTLGHAEQVPPAWASQWGEQ